MLEEPTTPTRSELEHLASLKERLVEFASTAGADFDVERWVTLPCRRSLGLVADSDPMVELLVSHRAAGVGPLFQDPVQVSPDVFLVKVVDDNGELFAEETWVIDEEQWRLDLCTFGESGYPVELALTSDATVEGLQSRLETIDHAISEGSTGTYAWLSHRCRVQQAEALEDYFAVLLVPLHDPGSEGNVLSVEFGGIAVVDYNDSVAEVTAVSTSTHLASGLATDRWVHEFGNWFYDGCSGGFTEAEISRLVTSHVTILDLEIDGLISTGFYDTYINGPLQRVFTYESATDQTTWWDAQEVYIETLFPSALDAAGYEVSAALRQTVVATSRQDSAATVSVRLESSGGDAGVQYFYVTIGYWRPGRASDRNAPVWITYASGTGSDQRCHRPSSIRPQQPIMLTRHLGRPHRHGTTAAVDDRGDWYPKHRSCRREAASVC